MTQSKRLALLVCDTPIPPVVETSGTYPKIFHYLLEQSSRDFDVSFTLDSFDVVSQQYPTSAQEDLYDGILITGSAASAYANVEWIKKLIAYIARIGKEKPHIKLIGICFGHQIISMAFGADCVPNGGKWEAGITPLDLTELGKQIFGVSALNIEQMHRDHVPTLPPTFHLLASTDISMNQAMVRFNNGAEPSENMTDIHIITTQGHPEFTADITSRIVVVREANGIMDSAIAKQAIERGGWRNDGPGPIMGAVWKMLGVPVKK